MPRRLGLLAALAATVALGLLSRLHPVGWGWYDKSLGDALYAVAAYLAFAVLMPRRSPWVIAAVSLPLCLAIEAFQATGIPASLGHLPGVRWLLGDTFSWHDIACYGVGAAAALALDAGALRLCGRRA